MNEYTASNGVTVRSESHWAGIRRIHFETEHEGDSITLTDRQTKALIEALEHERDEELGRWRWPLKPNFLVYEDESPDDVMVIDEAMAPSSPYLFARSSVSFEGDYGGAALAYFEAHPGSNPWEHAEPGEVWVLEAPEETPSTAVVFAHEDRTAGGVAGVTPEGYYVEFNNPHFVSGRRIFPESV